MHPLCTIRACFTPSPIQQKRAILPAIFKKSSDKSTPIGIDSSFDLPLPHHVHGLNAFQDSFRGVKLLEALRRLHLFLNEAMILFDQIVQVFDAPQFAVHCHNPILLRSAEGFYFRM